MTIFGEEIEDIIGDGIEEECTHCGTIVSIFDDECSECGKDTYFFTEKKEQREMHKEIMDATQRLIRRIRYES